MFTSEHVNLSLSVSVAYYVFQEMALFFIGPWEQSSVTRLILCDNHWWVGVAPQGLKGGVGAFVYRGLAPPDKIWRPRCGLGFNLYFTTRRLRPRRKQMRGRWYTFQLLFTIGILIYNNAKSAPKVFFGRGATFAIF